jgi:hypothetical protein
MQPIYTVMKKIMLLFLLTISWSAFPQIKNLRIAIGANTAIVPSVSTDAEINTHFPDYLGYTSYYVAVAKLEESYSSKPGFDLKGSFEVPVSNRLTFTTGLTFSYLNYQRKFSVIPMSNGIDWREETNTGTIGTPGSYFYGYIVEGIWNPDGTVSGGDPRWGDIRPVVTGDVSKVGKTTLVNAQIPLLLGATFHREKIFVNAGGVASVALYASSYQMNFLTAERQNNTDHFSTVSFGAMFSAGYNFTPKISAEVAGQHYFNPLYKSESQSGKARLNILSIGLRYRVAD